MADPICLDRRGGLPLLSSIRIYRYARILYRGYTFLDRMVDCIQQDMCSKSSIRLLGRYSRYVCSKCLSLWAHDGVVANCTIDRVVVFCLLSSIHDDSVLGFIWFRVYGRDVSITIYTIYMCLVFYCSPSDIPMSGMIFKYDMPPMKHHVYSPEHVVDKWFVHTGHRTQDTVPPTSTYLLPSPSPRR
jgi:hypothetical protein